MEERIHMVAPDGRIFNFKEWCDYLRDHPESGREPYVGEDGKIYEIDGFRFNVHGVCINPKQIRIEVDFGTYVEIRTYRNKFSREDPRIVWWCNIYSSNGAVEGFTRSRYLEVDQEDDAILESLRQARAAQIGKIEWYESAKEKAEKNGVSDSGYQRRIDTYKKMQGVIERELDNRMQLSLF